MMLARQSSGIALAPCSRTARGDTSRKSAAPFMRSGALPLGRTQRIQAPVIPTGPHEDREDTQQDQPIEVCLVRIGKANWPGGQDELPMGLVHLVVSFLAVRDQAPSQNSSPRSYRGNAATGLGVVFQPGQGQTDSSGRLGRHPPRYRYVEAF